MLLITEQHYHEAHKAIDLCLTTAPPKLIVSVLELRHELALQQGDLREAERIWKEILHRMNIPGLLAPKPKGRQP